MFFVTILAIAVTMFLILVRALLGPTVYDRILAINTLGSKTVLFVAVLGFLNGRPEFLDLGLTYALINFIGSVTVLKFMQYGDLGWEEASKDQSDV